MSLELEFVDYLKNNGNFDNFIAEIRDNYECLGRLGGTINIHRPTVEERLAIEGLLGTTLPAHGSLKIFYKNLIRDLQGTKFESIDLLKVLELYYGCPMVTNKEKRESEEKLFNQAKWELEKKYSHTPAGQWLENLKKVNSSLYNTCIRELQNDTNRIFSCLDGINQLPFHENKVMSLSIFANDLTKDPHFFDKSLPATILNDVAFYFAGRDKKHASHLEKNKALIHIGLTKEEILNYTTVSRIYAIDQNQNEHTGLSYFSNKYEPFNLHIGNLMSIKKIQKVDHVIILENPSVFQVLNDYAKDQQLDNISLVCSNGELNLATYLLLDKIKASGAKMYYAGDFDPEGLVIAAKLRRQYGDQLELLCYQPEHYYLTQSGKKLAPIRVGKLRFLDLYHDIHLQTIKSLLEETRNPGYQETLIAVYQEEMLKMSKGLTPLK